MDTPDTLRLEADPDDEYWEAYHRRDYTDRDQQSLLEAMSETFGSPEEAWNDIRRRERMAQACYDV